MQEFANWRPYRSCSSRPDHHDARKARRIGYTGDGRRPRNAFCERLLFADKTKRIRNLPVTVKVRSVLLSKTGKDVRWPNGRPCGRPAGRRVVGARRQFVAGAPRGRQQPGKRRPNVELRRKLRRKRQNLRADRLRVRPRRAARRANGQSQGRPSRPGPLRPSGLPKPRRQNRGLRSRPDRHRRPLARNAHPFPS